MGTKNLTHNLSVHNPQGDYVRSMGNDNFAFDACALYMLERVSFITQHQSNASNWYTIGYQTTIKQNVKLCITDYPKFSGISHEHQFRAVASSQAFQFILQDEEYKPETENERINYKLDLTFIYDVFKTAGLNDSMNFYLVKQNKPNKNG